MFALNAMRSFVEEHNFYRKKNPNAKMARRYRSLWEFNGAKTGTEQAEVTVFWTPSSSFPDGTTPSSATRIQPTQSTISRIMACETLSFIVFEAFHCLLHPFLDDIREDNTRTVSLDWI